MDERPLSQQNQHARLGGVWAYREGKSNIGNRIGQDAGKLVYVWATVWRRRFRTSPPGDLFMRQARQVARLQDGPLTATNPSFPARVTCRRDCERDIVDGD